MTLFEALPDDITEALYHYCKDDECLNDATLRALRTELKLGKVEHDKYSHDCFRCDKFKDYKNEFEPRFTELEEENAGLKARLNAVNLLTPELEKASKLRKRQLAKAKYIIKELLDFDFLPEVEIKKQAEQFLEEVKE